MKPLSLKLSKEKFNEIRRTSNKKILAYKKNREIAEDLSSKYTIFSKKHPVPLKKGIFDQLKEKLTYTDQEIKSFLRYWTMTKRYLNSVIQYSHRFDLNNVRCDEISESDKKYSEEMLKAKESRENDKIAKKNFKDVDPKNSVI